VKPFSYVMPTEVVLGAGVLKSLGERCNAFGRKPLVVMGRRSAKASGASDLVRAQLPNAVVFNGVEENPTTETCERGAALCRANRCDVVVALGGGSAMDVGKAVAGLALNPGPCADYLGPEKFAKGNLPVAAIPTTAGTGSEVTPYAVIVETTARVKRTITARGLFPVVALLDPELSRTMPRSVTVQTGLDALSQAMEGMVSRRATPLGDLLALETCRLVRAWLPRAAAEPENIEARSRMLYAAMLSGCIIAQSGTTLVHGMGYYFTLEFGLAHGLANALLLAPLFQYNAGRLPEKVAALATALGRPCKPTAAEARTNIATAIHGLLRDLGVSPAAKDAGVDPGRMPWCAEDIFIDRSRFKNQPGEPSLEEVTQFFCSACEGRTD
jgi:1,3-propanediol dehydrogenase/alcohol dehydrogenase